MTSRGPSSTSNIDPKASTYEISAFEVYWIKWCFRSLETTSCYWAEPRTRRRNHRGASNPRGNSIEPWVSYSCPTSSDRTNHTWIQCRGKIDFFMSGVLADSGWKASSSVLTVKVEQNVKHECEKDEEPERNRKRARFPGAAVVVDLTEGEQENPLVLD